MKNNKILLLVLVILLASCAPAPNSTPQSLMMEQVTPTLVRGDLTWEESILVTGLSEELGVAVDQIMVAEVEAVTWPDGCLGVGKIGVMCTQALVPGYRFVLDVDGMQYEYHTNLDMTIIVEVEESLINSSVVSEAIIQLAQNLRIEATDISLVSDEIVEFADVCLGVFYNDIKCTLLATSGHIIILEASDFVFEYHISNDGARIQPATIALTWSREGGFAGFCDQMTVFLSGEVYGSNCRSEDGRGGIFASLLSSEEQSQFFTWMEEYGQIHLDASDPPGVADEMSLLLSMNGSGNGKPGKPLQDELFRWSQNLYRRLYP